VDAVRRGKRAKQGTMQLLSLGGGVQSTTLLYMSLLGELPRLDGVIFADTGWEPTAVYTQAAKLKADCEAAGVPFYLVSEGHIRDDALESSSRFASMPLYVRNQDGTSSMIRRQCTSEYKIKPINRKVRELLGGKTRGKRVDQWLGISMEERLRMRDSRVSYIRLVYPLVEKRMRRYDCLRWLEARGFPAPPKSACIGCPFHSDAQWRDLKRNHPQDFADAVAFDDAIRNGNVRLGKAALRGQAYLHRSLKPLLEVDFSNAEDKGQLSLFSVLECEGMCGL
jgi:hypothetical protein